MKKSRVARIVQILTTLQAGKSYTAADLSRMLGTSRRTIFRDLKELQDIGIPYRYDAGTGGYVIDPEFFLPPLDLNLQEALSLLLVVHRASEHIQVPFKRSAQLAGLKIENNLPANIRAYCNAALESVSARGGAQAPTDLLDKTYAQLQTAIVKRRRVAMRYHSLFDGKVIDVELCPYYLFYNHRAWYVIGYSDIHKSTRTFKLNRIKAVEVTERRFADEKRFDLYEYLGRAWSMIPEGRLYHVRLRFLPKVADNVTEVRWHSTQQASRRPDGSAIVEFRVDGLGEITWWILGYGDQVEVLGPAALRKRVAQTAQRMVELNTAAK